jgi:hypothetical protein
LAEIAAEVLPLGGIQAFQGSLIAPLPFLPLRTNPPQKQQQTLSVLAVPQGSSFAQQHIKKTTSYCIEALPTVAG